MPQKQKQGLKSRLVAKSSDISPPLPSPPLEGEGLGVGSISHGKHRKQKSYASGSPPFGEDGRVLFPLGEDLGEAVEGLGVGAISHGKHRKHRKATPAVPLPLGRTGGGFSL